MSFINDTTMYSCPICGYILKENVKLYNENLRKQNIKVSPILPTCLLCGSEITINSKNIYNTHSKLLAITGTCASGKSATAEILMQQYGFDVIDGDCVMQVVKCKLGLEKIEYNMPEMYAEIERQIDILLCMQKDIVISHIITPSDIDKYREIFKKRKLQYKIILLKPKYISAVMRSKTRTSHKSITPEEWVKYFYDELIGLEQQDNKDVIVFDNSDYSVEESVERILEIFNENT